MAQARKSAWAVVDTETLGVMSRHRTRENARKAQENYGPPSRVLYTTRRVGEKRKAQTEAEVADAFTARCWDVLSRVR